MLKLTLRDIVNQSEHYKISEPVDTISTIFMTRASLQTIVLLKDNIGKYHTSGNLDCHGKTRIALQQITNEVLRETLQTRGTSLLPVLSANIVFCSIRSARGQLFWKETPRRGNHVLFLYRKTIDRTGQVKQNITTARENKSCIL